MHIFTYLFIHTYIHSFIHTYMHAYIHTYIHTYVHTYIHTYRWWIGQLDFYIYIYMHIYKFAIKNIWIDGWIDMMATWVTTVSTPNVGFPIHTEVSKDRCMPQKEQSLVLLKYPLIDQAKWAEISACIRVVCRHKKKQIHWTRINTNTMVMRFFPDQTYLYRI